MGIIQIMETATLGGGCFWCTEGIFNQIKGVTKVTSGYSGGIMENPTSMQVYSGKTGHAECIQVRFDPNIINYKDILYIFFKTHDPTSLNKQGYDVGDEYRSVIFYHSAGQNEIAETLKSNLQKDYPNPIVTEIVPFENFYTAEDYHQNFYTKNPNKAYCVLVIDPKIQKLKKDFKQYLK